MKTELITNIEMWLESEENGWTQEQRIMAHAYETGMMKELDFDLEDYFDEEWQKWVIANES